MLDEMTGRLGAAIPSNLAAMGARLARVRGVLRLGVASAVPPHAADLVRAKAQLAAAGKMLAAPHRRAIASKSATLQALSPLGVLARGYSIARNGSGAVVDSVAKAMVGGMLSVQLADGVIESVVRNIETEELALEDIDG